MASCCEAAGFTTVNPAPLLTASFVLGPGVLPPRAGARGARARGADADGASAGPRPCDAADAPPTDSCGTGAAADG